MSRKKHVPDRSAPSQVLPLQHFSDDDIKTIAAKHKIPYTPNLKHQFDHAARAFWEANPRGAQLDLKGHRLLLRECVRAALDLAGLLDKLGTQELVALANHSQEPIGDLVPRITADAKRFAAIATAAASPRDKKGHLKGKGGRPKRWVIQPCLLQLALIYMRTGKKASASYNPIKGTWGGHFLRFVQDFCARIDPTFKMPASTLAAEIKNLPKPPPKHKT